MRTALIGVMKAWVLSLRHLRSSCRQLFYNQDSKRIHWLSETSAEGLLIIMHLLWHGYRDYWRRRTAAEICNEQPWCHCHQDTRGEVSTLWETESKPELYQSGMKDLRDMADFSDSYFTAILQHYQRILIRAAIQQQHQRVTICMKPDFWEYSEIPWQC